MKNLTLILAILASTTCFAQYDHNIELNAGSTVTHSVTEIDSISFSIDGAPMLQMNLLNGETDNYELNLINQVTFSGEPLNDPFPPGTVHCIPGGTAVVEVLNPVTGQIWMDRNLGASQAATSSTDEASYGDLYQWGRFSDGHQCRTSPTTSTISSSDTPGHGQFILSNSSNNTDWRSPQNNNLWQGVNGINNPCPSGYRLPTEPELNAERLSWSAYTFVGAFGSPLKLSAAGLRFNDDGTVNFVGSNGRYWSSAVSGIFARFLYFYSSNAFVYDYYRGFGGSVRCLKD